MISAEQLSIFEEKGAVTVDTPLTAQQITAAVTAIDSLLPFKKAEEGQTQRYRYGATCNYYEPALIDLIQHPFFEAVAKRVLHAEAIRFFQTAILATYPQPGEFTYDQHTDIQFSLEDWARTPRRVVCSFFLWLTDVNEKRSPMMHRPGSHRLIAAARSANPALKDTPPAIEGIKMEDLPPAYAAAQPVVAKAGQVTVLTTSLIHGGSKNIDSEPRKALVMTYTSAGIAIGLPQHQATVKRAYDIELRKLLRPERAHLVDFSEADNVLTN